MEESYRLQILHKYFYYKGTGIQYKNKHKADSVIKKFPEIIAPGYYLSLLKKQQRKDSPPFIYTKTEVKITPSKYRELIIRINESGFWDLPLSINCDAPPMDYSMGFILEANTKTKYNFVSLNACPSKAIDFSEACRSIIETAGLGKKINLVDQSEQLH